jgi:hypothetical protein
MLLANVRRREKDGVHDVSEAITSEMEAQGPRRVAPRPKFASWYVQKRAAQRHEIFKGRCSLEAGKVYLVRPRASWIWKDVQRL